MSIRLIPRGGLLVALLILRFSVSHAAGAPDGLPVLNAHSHTLDLREGRRLSRGAWEADPKLALDHQVVRATGGFAEFALISDRDSLLLTIPAGESRDFIVVLDGTDSCRTRITALDQGMRSVRAPGVPADTLALDIARDGRVYLTGTVNGSRPLRLMFDTGGAVGALDPSGIQKGASFVPTDTILNAGGGGTTMRPSSKDNHFEIGTGRWRNTEFLLIEKQLPDCDGLVGWWIFDQRVAAFDFVHRRVVVTDSMVALPEGYRETPLRWVGGLPAIEVELIVRGTRVRELLVLDTGSNSALRLTAGTAHAALFRDSLEAVGRGSSRGVGPKVRKSRYVVVPELDVAGHVLKQVDSEWEEPMEGQDPGAAHLGMGAIDHFDLIVDFRNDRVFLRPNARFDEPVGRGRGGRDPVTAVAVSVFAVALSVSAVYGFRRARNAKP